jgi:L-seryl-tRNA(Ser) seleniumtransferase
MRRTLSRVRGLKATPFVPEIANSVPHLRVQWDGKKLGLTELDVMKQLREGQPSIELVPTNPKPGEGVEIASWMLQPGEAEIVAGRMEEILGPKA